MPEIVSIDINFGDDDFDCFAVADVVVGNICHLQSSRDCRSSFLPSPPPLSLSSSASLFLSHNLIAGFHTVPLIDRSIGSGTRARATSSRLGKFGLHSRGRKSDVQTGRFALPDGAIGDRFCCARVTTDETAEEDRQRKRNGGTVRCCGHGRLPSTSSDSFGRRRRRRHCHANSSLHKEL